MRFCARVQVLVLWEPCLEVSRRGAEWLSKPDVWMLIATTHSLSTGRYGINCEDMSKGVCVELGPRDRLSKPPPRLDFHRIAKQVRFADFRTRSLLQ